MSVDDRGRTMNRQTSKRTNQRRNTRPKRPTAVDLWRTPEDLPALEPVVVSSDVGALLRSLGEPPMAGAGTGAGLRGNAGNYFEAVAERAAAIARALALSAGLLGDEI